jgi:hypothetical protein
MSHERASNAVGLEEVHARILAVMQQLKLPSPEKMLRRIESMLSKGDREAVLRELLSGCEGQDAKDLREALRDLAPSRAEWITEVDRLFAGYPPTAR